MSRTLRVDHRSRMRGSKYWYYTITTECVLCGKTTVERIRRYDKKPGINKRSEYGQYACDWHFM